MTLALVLPAASAQAAVPGNNGKIAFASARHEPNGGGCNPNCNIEIYTMNPDGTGQTRLTTNPGVDRDPAWSPDGQRIAFIRGIEVWVMNADGSGQTSLDPFGHGLSWSPDGRKIAFGRNDDGAGPEGLNVTNADGSGTTLIVSGDQGHEVLDTAWSPDGRKIAFHMLDLVTSTNPFQIWTAHALARSLGPRHRDPDIEQRLLLQLCDAGLGSGRHQDRLLGHECRDRKDNEPGRDLGNFHHQRLPTGVVS